MTPVLPAHCTWSPVSSSATVSITTGIKCKKLKLSLELERKYTTDLSREGNIGGKCVFEKSCHLVSVRPEVKGGPRTQVLSLVLVN